MTLNLAKLRTDVRHENGQITRDGKTYGCRVDLSDDEEPDGCVIDRCPSDCNFTVLPSGRTRTSRWTCKYCKPVKEPRA